MGDGMAEQGLVELVYSNADLAVGTSGNLFFVVWKKETNTEGMNALRARFDAFSASRGKEVGLITVVAASAPMPEPGPKQALATWMSDVSPKIVVSTLLVEGTGFAAASARFVVTSLTMLAKQAFPHRVFGSIEDAAVWFDASATQAGASFPKHELVNRYRQFRALAG